MQELTEKQPFWGQLWWSIHYNIGHAVSDKLNTGQLYYGPCTSHIRQWLLWLSRDHQLQLRNLITQLLNSPRELSCILLNWLIICTKTLTLSTLSSQQHCWHVFLNKGEKSSCYSNGYKPEAYILLFSISAYQLLQMTLLSK